PNSLAYGRMRSMKAERRAREALLLRHGNQNLELVYVHSDHLKVIRPAGPAYPITTYYVSIKILTLTCRGAKPRIWALRPQEEPLYVKGQSENLRYHVA